MTPGKNLLHPLTALRFFAALFIVQVHLLGSSRVIAGVLDHNIDNGAPTLEASSRWRRNVRFPSAKLQGIDEIGFSMYTDVKNLYPIDGAANTDWGSRRLIFPVPQNWQHNCAN